MENLLMVFVYGSLRRGCANHHLLEGAEFAGAGTVEGSLYVRGDLSMAHEGPGTVHGEVYRLGEVNHLHTLDGLERHPTWYVRRRVPVTLRDGSKLDAWCYFKAERDPEARPVESAS